MSDLTDEMRSWSIGRSPWWRLLLFGFLAMQVLRHLGSMDDRTLFSGITFGAHEFGHLFFALMGEWMGIAGGSLMQLLVPIGAAAVVWRSRDWFGIAVCGVFLAASLADLAWYVADARAQELDLVSFSPDGAVHDWSYLLGSMGILRHDLAVARLVRAVAFLVLLGSTVLTLRLGWWMWTLKPPPGEPARP